MPGRLFAAKSRTLLGLAAAMWLVVAVAGSCTRSGAGTSPTGPQPPPALDSLREKIDHALDYTFEHRKLSLETHAAWQILHGVLAYPKRFKVEREGKMVSAVDHLLRGGEMKGWDLVSGSPLPPDGKRRGVIARMASGTGTGQGHADQWLAVMAQCELPPTQTIKVEGQEFTMADWVRQVELDIHRNRLREYSWTLIGLTSYRPTDHRWQAADGQWWSIARLVKHEAQQDLATSACGGTHRMIGLAMAVNRRLEQVESGLAEPGAASSQDDPYADAWQVAEQRIQEAVELARRHQNPDGSFSTHYLARPGISTDQADSLSKTGHVLEFLTFALTKEQLQEPWVRRAVDRLCELFRSTEGVDLECGALYHAAHGLAIYRQRMFGEPWRPAAERNAPKQPSASGRPSPTR